MPYGITQCYLPPDRGENPAFTRSRSRYSISDPGGMQGGVDLYYVKATGRELNPRPVNRKSNTLQPTAEPPRNTLAPTAFHPIRLPPASSEFPGHTEREPAGSSGAC